MNRSPTSSISTARGELFRFAAMGSRVDIRCQLFKQLVPCRNLAAVIECDGQVKSSASCVGAEARFQRSRRIHLARRLIVDPGIDVPGWRYTITPPNHSVVHEDVK